MSQSPPLCYGRYLDPQDCFGCQYEQRCLQAAYLMEQREANTNRRRARGKVPSHLRPLLKLGYPAGVLKDW